MGSSSPESYSSIPMLQMWSGNLQSTTTDPKTDDMVVLLINGADILTAMTASLADIFADLGSQGTATQVSMAWEIRHLWANRISDEEAGQIIGNANKAGDAATGYDAATASPGGDSGVGAGQVRYNATKTSYAQGLKAGDDLLLGKVIGTVQPDGTVSATVDPHGVRALRLRGLGTGSG